MTQQEIKIEVNHHDDRQGDHDNSILWLLEFSTVNTKLKSICIHVDSETIGSCEETSK